jgi:hypothetical protein
MSRLDGVCLVADVLQATVQRTTSIVVSVLWYALQGGVEDIAAMLTNQIYRLESDRIKSKLVH